MAVPFLCAARAEEVCRRSGAWGARSSGEGRSPTRLHTYTQGIYEAHFPAQLQYENHLIDAKAVVLNHKIQ